MSVAEVATIVMQTLATGATGLLSALLGIVGAIGLAVRFLFENWIVQALFGAWVVFSLQQQHQKSVWRIEQVQRRYEQKLAAVRSFFEMVDKRIYASRVYLDTLRLPLDSADWLTEREKYRGVVREWNEKAPSAHVALLMLLPARYCYQLERDTFPAFAEVERSLRSIRKLRESGARNGADQGTVEAQIAALSDNSRTSLSEFLKLAKDEQRLIDQRPEISEANRPELSYGYLLSALFKSSVH